jgi:hypothetical protein
MSALLNRNEQKMISWKDKTFYQITSTIQKNKKGVSTVRQTMSALPLPINRREIATDNACNFKNPRIGVSIDDINSPGGYLVRNVASNGNNGVIMPGKINNKGESGTCLVNDAGSPGDYNKRIMCVANNARVRVRGSNMNKSNYVVNTEGKTSARFFNNTKEYLNNRTKSFEKNQNTLDSCVVFDPSNKHYQQQGAVSSSTHVLGRKVDTITQTANVFYKNNGYNLPNSISYGVNQNINNYKEKLGYPLPNTPFVKKNNIYCCKPNFSCRT